MAESSEQGSIVAEDDFAIACAGIPIPLFNTAFIFGAVTPARLRELILRARDYFAARSVPGCFVIPDVWESQGGSPTFASFDMTASLRTTGMRATDLAPAARPLPPVDLRELGSDEAAHLIADVNADAYGLDARAAHAMTLPALWKPPVRAYAVFENRNAVSVGAAALLEGISYIMWMATRPAARRRGYAEAIIRRAIADCSAPSVLHATDAGLPVYQRLGYKSVVTFPGYVFPTTGWQT